MNTYNLKKTKSEPNFNTMSYLTAFENLIKRSPEDTLGAVLPLVKSSHEPVFVFDNKDKFIGLVSPNNVLYSHRYPYKTKLSSVVIKPPVINEKTGLPKVASYMLESRVYVLPVFDQKKHILGVLRGREILQDLIKDADFLAYISSAVKVRTPITAESNSSVGVIFQKMQDKNISRVLLTNEEGSIYGMVSKKDLQNAFMKPSQKQRFGKNGNQQTDRAFDEEKIYRSDEPATMYAVKSVFSLPIVKSSQEVFKIFIESDYNSVVLVDELNKPIGFLSNRDVLEGLASLQLEENLNLIITRPTKNVSEAEVREAKVALAQFGRKLNQRIAIDKIEITFNEPKTPVGKSLIFNTSLIVSPVAGAKIISKTKSRSFLNGIHSAMAQIDKQQRRSNIAKLENRHIGL